MLHSKESKGKNERIVGAEEEKPAKKSLKVRKKKEAGKITDFVKSITLAVKDEIWQKLLPVNPVGNLFP